MLKKIRQWYPMSEIGEQLAQDLRGKDAFRGNPQSYSWLANQLGHFSLGFFLVLLVNYIIVLIESFFHISVPYDFEISSGIASVLILILEFSYFTPTLKGIIYFKQDEKRSRLSTFFRFENKEKCNGMSACLFLKGNEKCQGMPTCLLYQDNEKRHGLSTDIFSEENEKVNGLSTFFLWQDFLFDLWYFALGIIWAYVVMTRDFASDFEFCGSLMALLLLISAFSIGLIVYNLRKDIDKAGYPFFFNLLKKDRGLDCIISQSAVRNFINKVINESDGNLFDLHIYGPPGSGRTMLAVGIGNYLTYSYKKSKYFSGLKYKELLLENDSYEDDHWVNSELSERDIIIMDDYSGDLFIDYDVKMLKKYHIIWVHSPNNQNKQSINISFYRQGVTSFYARTNRFFERYSCDSENEK